MRTPITRPRKRSPASRSSVICSDVMEKLCAKPARIRKGRASTGLGICAKMTSITYQRDEHVIINRVSRVAELTWLKRSEPIRAPTAKLATR